MELLSIDKLTKTFGGIGAVKNFSFSADSNRITALIGPNGAGKTTVFNLISRIIKADSGSIIYNNINLLNQKPHRLMQLGISRTFQNVVLFDNMPLIDNIMIGGHIKCHPGIIKYLFSFSLSWKEDKILREKSEYFLEFAGLKDKINSSIAELAFGQQRLAEIARALVSEPDFILLDEPAAGLNPKETEQLGELLCKIKALQKTILIVEHDMNLVMNISDKIVVMNFGEFLAEGKPADILANKDVISAYLGDDELC
ncbi:MAG TPA: ABC transporter ATP-binding protein [bacterium]|nr:ABC transporter ATP-binding protein [bacterium]HPN32452.1 ABC transporter ATP-binding protein [bacterium]